MPEHIIFEPFEQQIINSIESLLLDDDKAHDYVCHTDDDKPIVTPVTSVIDQNANRSKPRPKFQLNLNETYFKESSHTRAAVNGEYSRSPIIDAASYGGTQDYARWSTIESDELSSFRQMSYALPNGSAPDPLPRTPATPISPFSDIESPMSPAQLSPLHTTQLLLHQYLLNNQHNIAEELKLHNLAQYFNMATVGMPVLPFMNTTLNNIAYNQMAQQRLFNQEQEYRRISNYYTNVKNRRMLTAPPKVYCTFCKNNGEPP